MRWLILWVSALLVASGIAFAASDPAVENLKSRLESARPEDRPELCLQIARRQLSNADKFYSEGSVEQARAAIQDIVTYSEKASDAATATHKHQKKVEITVRKMSEKLRDIKRSLAFEDQAPVDAAVKQLEGIRTSLLNAMFGKGKK